MFKNITKSASWKLVGAFAVGLAASTGVFANPTMSDVSACVEPTDPNAPPCEGTWVIGDTGTPVDITGPWLKNLNGVSTVSGGTQQLVEHLNVPAGGRLSSWTEVILGTDWEWVPFGADGAVFDISTLNWMTFFNGTVSGFGTQTLTFTFDELITFDADPNNGFGVDFGIDIAKRMQCTRGGDGCANGPTVLENPMPEPGTLLLLGAGLAGFGLRRRRNA